MLSNGVRNFIIPYIKLFKNCVCEFHVCRCVCAGVCVQAHIPRCDMEVRGQTWVPALPSTFLRRGLLSAAACARLGGSRASGNSCVSTSILSFEDQGYRQVLPYPLPLALGIELRSLHLWGRHFSLGAVSPATVHSSLPSCLNVS